jgi:hypothetical protein
MKFENGIISDFIQTSWTEVQPPSGDKKSAVVNGSALVFKKSITLFSLRLRALWQQLVRLILRFVFDQ